MVKLRSSNPARLKGRGLPTDAPQKSPAQDQEISPGQAVAQMLQHPDANTIILWPSMCGALTERDVKQLAGLAKQNKRIYAVNPQNRKAFESMVQAGILAGIVVPDLDKGQVVYRLVTAADLGG
jgi:hypothetical protein